MLAIRVGGTQCMPGSLASGALSLRSFWWKLAPLPGPGALPTRMWSFFLYSFFLKVKKKGVRSQLTSENSGIPEKKVRIGVRLAVFLFASGGRPSSRKNDDENNGWWRIALVSGDNHQGVDEIACPTVCARSEVSAWLPWVELLCHNLDRAQLESFVQKDRF